MLDKIGTIRRLTNCILTGVLAVWLTATWGCKSKPEPSTGQGTATSVDRTVLPLAQPNYPAITELDVRKATAPPLFQVKAPPGAPNVIVILLDNLGFGATKPFGGAINMPRWSASPRTA